MKKPAHISVQEYVTIGVFAALLAVLSQIAVPTPSGVPLTLQTFAVALCGFVLGFRRGILAVLCYLLMGAIGLPVFANFRGGFFLFVGPTGGFLIGFLFLAALCDAKHLWLAGIGLVICHLLGAMQYAFVAGVGLSQSVAAVTLPYLLKDVASVVAARLAAGLIKNRLAAVAKRIVR